MCCWTRYLYALRICWASAWLRDLRPFTTTFTRRKQRLHRAITSLLFFILTLACDLSRCHWQASSCHSHCRALPICVSYWHSFDSFGAMTKRTTVCYTPNSDRKPLCFLSNTNQCMMYVWRNSPTNYYYSRQPDVILLNANDQTNKHMIGCVFCLVIRTNVEHHASRNCVLLAFTQTNVLTSSQEQCMWALQSVSTLQEEKKCRRKTEQLHCIALYIYISMSSFRHIMIWYTALAKHCAEQIAYESVCTYILMPAGISRTYHKIYSSIQCNFSFP